MKTAFKRNNRFSLLILCVILTAGCALPTYTIDLGDLGQFTINLGGAATSPQPTLPAAQPVIQSTPVPAANTNRADCLAGIFPGATDLARVQAILGAPTAYQQQDGFEILFYQSGVSRQFNTVILSGGVVYSVSVPGGTDDPPWSTVKSQLGQPEITAYSDMAHGARLFAYPGQGIMVAADDVLDVIYSRTCFMPMTVEVFNTQYGSSLLSEDPFEQ